MAISRRRILRLALRSAAFPLFARPSSAQSYPNRYVRLVVPFPPGGGGDALARPLANRLSEMWGQQLVVENKPGAGGNVGAQAVAQAAPDGYTLLLGAAFLAITPTLYPSAGYNVIRDLVPITLVTTIPNLMMVPNSSPAKSVKEFIDYAKANPGKVTFASTGIGASPHLSGELLKHQAGIDMTHIPYRGAGPAINDLIPGRVDLMFSNLPGVLSHVQSGTVRGLAVTSAGRSEAFLEIPTIGETLQGYEVESWWGLYAPTNTPSAISAKLHADTIQALQHPSVRDRFAAVGAPVKTSTPSELADLLTADIKKWAPIIRAANIKPE